MDQPDTDQNDIEARDRVRTEEHLRQIVRAPSGLVVDKELGHIDRFARAFIEHSPFFVMATSGEGGRLDATPRGDPAGFVRVLDEKRLLMPERKGNNRVDSMRNILINPHVGTIFFIPGRTDTLRVNGTAAIVSDQDLLAPLAEQNKVPKLGVLVEVEEVFFQCAAALNRSRLWNYEDWPDETVVASLGTALVEQTGMDIDSQELDANLEQWNDNPY